MAFLKRQFSSNSRLLEADYQDAFIPPASANQNASMQ
jgi:hypothetical protein